MPSTIHPHIGIMAGGGMAIGADAVVRAGIVVVSADVVAGGGLAMVQADMTAMVSTKRPDA
ncbi:MAG: hypothetical protein ACRKGH_08135 [Dehalogenimonas sp.]